MQVVHVEWRCRAAVRRLSREERARVHLHLFGDLPTGVLLDAGDLEGWVLAALARSSGPVHLSARTSGVDAAGDVRLSIQIGSEERAFSGPIARPDLRRPRPGPPVGARVVVVDDDPVGRTVISTILRSAGCAVVEAEEGRRGLDLATAETALVLLDMHLPGWDGPEVARRLRAHGFRAPIVAITANAMPEDRVICLESGMNDTAIKPVPRHDLVELVGVWTGG